MVNFNKAISSVRVSVEWLFGDMVEFFKFVDFKKTLKVGLSSVGKIKITDHFTCTSANFIYCITWTLCKKLYIGETGRRLGDRFREHLRDVEKDDKNASKPVARHFNLPNHSKQHMSVCGLSLHQGSTESRKTLEQKFIFQIGTLNPHGIRQRTLIYNNL